MSDFDITLMQKLQVPRDVLDAEDVNAIMEARKWIYEMLDRHKSAGVVAVALHVIMAELLVTNLVLRGDTTFTEGMRIAMDSIGAVSSKIMLTKRALIAEEWTKLRKDQLTKEI